MQGGASAEWCKHKVQSGACAEWRKCRVQSGAERRVVRVQSAGWCECRAQSGASAECIVVQVQSGAEWCRCRVVQVPSVEWCKCRAQSGASAERRVVQVQSAERCKCRVRGWGPGSVVVRLKFICCQRLRLCEAWALLSEPVVLRGQGAAVTGCGAVRCSARLRRCSEAEVEFVRG